jgi:peptidoglycan/xylan/chitin deacetylase (PgdA/CDA1 family)
MKIYITFDYELYFGDRSGTLEKCILAPTRELIRIAEKHGVRFVFFVDCGYLLALKRYALHFPQLQQELDAVSSQIKYLSDSGHDIQLHIHPHWEDTVYTSEGWKMNVSRYKLADFSDAEAEDIIARYHAVLYQITGKEIFAYRAGGWCIQPFSKMEKAFRKLGVWLDSTVFRGGKFRTIQYSYDFSTAPDKDIYRFENDPVAEVSKGYFLELPISSIRNSPLFFWRLFYLGRKDPHMHKPLGDGVAMAAPGYRKRLLTRFTLNPVSVDGYNAHLLDSALGRSRRKGAEHMVVIGHPKALSRYSLQKLEQFIEEKKSSEEFTTFTKQFGK